MESLRFFIYVYKNCSHSLYVRISRMSLIKDFKSTLGEIWNLFMTAEIFLLLLNGLHARFFVCWSCSDCYFITRNEHMDVCMTNIYFTLVKWNFFHVHSQLYMSNTMFLGCVEESCDISLESNLPASVTARDWLFLPVKRSWYILWKDNLCYKILLATQKSIKPPYLVLNASQTDFNGAAIFSQTYFRLHPLCLT